MTLVRAAGRPFAEDELGLLTLLVDQLGVAVQNARDYRERLEQAVRDPLTGLYNRRYLFEALDKEVHRVERYGSTASLVLFDVDDFKRINDTLGHAAGDEVLRRLRVIVEEIIRPVDSFARIGGEEFALLLPETAQLDALLVAERIRAAIARRRILPDRRVTVSGGVATVPQDARTVDEVERAADQALYWAKRNGKDLCAVASEVVVAQDDCERDAIVAHLYALVAGIDAQHLHTRDHSENVAAYAVAMGKALGLDRERVRAPAPGGPPARRGQDRRSRRDPREARGSDGRRVPRDAAAPHGRRGRCSPTPASRRRRAGFATITSASTAPATPTRSAAPTSRSRRASSSSRTPSRR